MNNHRYILEPYKSPKSRYHCPQCNSKEKTFSLYIDTETGQYVSDIVGRCNRENNCGYHYTPKQYFQDNNISIEKNTSHIPFVRSETLRTANERTEQTASFIDTTIFQSSLTGYDRNTFTQWLTGLFGEETTAEVIKRYQIGTSKHWQRATIFYQINIAGNIRAGKIMLYDNNGHRIKEPFNYVTWVHSVLKIEPYYLKQCLFGEHLLKGNTLPVAIVESEKTACITSIYLPQFIWVACGQLQGLNVDKCKVLAGRTVLLFPDLKGFDKWQIKAKELQSLLPDVRFVVSDYLERNASEADRAKGLDIADYLSKFDVKDFRQDVPAKPIFKFVHIKELTYSFEYLINDFPILREPREFNGNTITDPCTWIYEKLEAIADHYPTSGLTKDLPTDVQAIYSEVLQFRDLCIKISRKVLTENQKAIAA